MFMASQDMENYEAKKIGELRNLVNYAYVTPREKTTNSYKSLVVSQAHRIKKLFVTLKKSYKVLDWQHGLFNAGTQLLFLYFLIYLLFFSF
jgi:hypothetical protein